MALLTDYDALATNTFIKIETPLEDWLFSDRNTSTTFGGDTYLAAGDILSIERTRSELRVSSNQLTITLSGVPNTAIADILDTKLKGSPVYLYRGFFDISTGAWLDLPTNPVLRYRGFVNNYGINEEYNVNARTGTNTIQLMCSSSIDQLQYKTSGRTTSPASMKKFYSTDVSFDRVPKLEDTTFNFGAPK